MSIARESDKIPFVRLSWQDPELLMRVIDERLIANYQPDLPPAEMWSRYFTESANGIPVREYILSRILPRPRDLVFLVKSAVATAINRGHTRVQDIDIIEAQKQYSQYAVESILVEDDAAIPILENVLLEFVGSRPILTQEGVIETVLKAGVPYSQVSQVVEHLCALAFLGAEVADDTFRFATKGALRYKINIPFRSFLEIEAAQAE